MEARNEPTFTIVASGLLLTGLSSNTISRFSFNNKGLCSISWKINANRSHFCFAAISAGELLDKISILEIKLKKIKDKENLKEINKEYAILKQSQNLNIKLTNELKDLFDELKKVNLNLWDIEDKLRICEKNKDFGEKFIELARKVYFNNDSRAKIKSEINKLSGSNIKEIKQYSDY